MDENTLNQVKIINRYSVKVVGDWTLKVRVHTLKYVHKIMFTQNEL